MLLRASLLTALAVFLPAAQARAQQEPAPVSGSSSGANPVVVIETSRGPITVELFPEQAPLTVENFLQYVDDGHYTDTIFHRVIAGMIIQGGGLTPEGEEKPTRKPIPLESDNGLLNVRGSIAMARGADKDSATAQFYINVGDNPAFDRGPQRFGYAVFGRVIEGMAVVDRISKVQTSRRGNYDDIPILPVFIDKARRAAAPAEAAP
jgi:cyclophilin family peptidyl-prolyl cis-trans isomerase